MNFLSSDDNIYDVVMKDNGVDWLVNKLSRVSLEDKWFIYLTMQERALVKSKEVPKKKSKKPNTSIQLNEAFKDIPSDIETFDEREFWNSLKTSEILHDSLSIFIYAVHLLKVHNTPAIDN